LLNDLGVRLTIRRKPLLWYGDSDASTHADSGFPCYLFELPHGIFYGFPAIDARGVKVAEHTGGDIVDNPANVDRGLHETDHASVDAFLRMHLPAVEPRAAAHSVCLYTMSPDEHFIVDRHPHDPRIVFAAGLSGHGFKFTPVLGRVLTELAIEGRTDLPIDFLSLARFAK
jgi:glycine/D-amino acid oxidase-like deaminating enzyme